jgi:hypothetical protein
MGWIARVQFPAGERDISLLYSSQTSSGAIHPPIQWILGAISAGEKQQRCEADHSPPSNAKAKNDGAIASTLPYVFMVWYLIN